MMKLNKKENKKMKKSSKVISGLLLASTFATMSSNVFAVETNKTIEKKLLAGDIIDMKQL